MIVDSPAKRRAVLDRSRTVAMVGASPNPLRPSYFVFRYLRTHGFDVWGINPNYAEIDGVKCYPTLADFAREHGPPDVVDVYRRPSETPPIAHDAVAVKAKAIWFQYGVINGDAIRIADEAGLDVIYDRCMKVEHARFSGGLSVAGMDSGVLSARRRTGSLKPS